jgi:uncharacterized YccA/Bax inhibitor family protein
MPQARKIPSMRRIIPMADSTASRWIPARSSNPALNDKTFSQPWRVDAEDAMTVQGTVNKTGILMLCVMIPAFFMWRAVFQSPDSSWVSTWLGVGAIGGFIVAMVTIFKQTWAPVTAPLYSLLEGVALGGISAIMELSYPGIAIQAVGLTFGTLVMVLAAYTSGLVKATENFKMGIVAATGAIALVYLVSIVLGLFGVRVPLIHDSGIFGIIFSLVVVVIAALNLVLDFDFIENGARMGAPKYMEWYGAFGLMVTLIWLYLEILRLLAKLRSRD